MKAAFSWGLAVLLLALFWSGTGQAQALTSTTEGLLGGGVLGAGAGALVGSAVGHPLGGALIGGGLGAAAGGLIGHGLQVDQERNYQLAGEVSAEQQELARQRAEIHQLQAQEIDRLQAQQARSVQIQQQQMAESLETE
ncbi:MAG TPA: glycine zipper domain-containing protein [Candidatus Binataceae bacterium]|nr:glycine zipper domain-containing protein [Candidatus Binataceae bacterium]